MYNIETVIFSISERLTEWEKALFDIFLVFYNWKVIIKPYSACTLLLKLHYEVHMFLIWISSLICQTLYYRKLL